MYIYIYTLLREALPLVLIVHVRRLPLDRLIAVRLRLLHAHHLAEELEAVHLLDGIQAGLLAVEDDESLALALETALCDDLNDLPVVLEDDGERLLQVVDLLALVEVVDLFATG